MKLLTGRQLKEGLRAKARELRLDHLAVTHARPSKVFCEFKDWISKGYHGEMSFLARSDNLARREDPRVILPGVMSAIMVTLHYSKVAPAPSGGDFDMDCGRLRAVVSQWARGVDYHKILGEKLRVLCDWLNERGGGESIYYVDTGSIFERDFARRAGLGFIGKNTMLIHPGEGSLFFIGEILSTLGIPPDTPEKMPVCGSCTRCIDACPAGAIKAPYVIDAGKCISYLTIEHKGSIPEELRPTMGWRIFGCDVCQEVCPWNRKDQIFLSNVQRPVRDNSMVSGLIHLFQMSDEMFENEFKGTPVWRTGRVRLQRNIAIALGNLKCEKSVPFLEKALESPEALIREHALWALRHIRRCQD